MIIILSIMFKLWYSTSISFPSHLRYDYNMFSENYNIIVVRSWYEEKRRRTYRAKSFSLKCRALHPALYYSAEKVHIVMCLYLRSDQLTYWDNINIMYIQMRFRRTVRYNLMGKQFGRQNLSIFRKHIKMMNSMY